MTNNTVISPVYPMLIQKYNTLIPDQNANVLDKINTIIDYLNQTGKLTNDVVNQWNQVMAWAMNDGLNTDVSNKLETMLSNGEFDTLFQKYIAPSLGDIKTLQTNDKTSAVNAINEVDQLAKTNQTNLGTLANLVTADKSSLVNAVNEVDNLGKSNQTNIGTLSNLQTTDKGNLVAAINDNVASLAAIATIPQRASGETDDSPSINRAIANGATVIQLPANVKLNSPINATNRADNPLKFIGQGWSQNGGAGTKVNANTGGVAFDCTGSQFITFEDMLIYSDSSMSNPSTIGILVARGSNSLYAQFHNYKRLFIQLVSKPSYSARGSIGIANITGEHMNYEHGFIIADLPLALMVSNVLNLSSPFTTFGSILSMTFCSFKQVGFRPWTQSAVEMWGAQNIDFDKCYFSPANGNSTVQAIVFNNGCSDISITGQIEEFGRALQLNNDVTNLYLDVFMASATTSYVYLSPGIHVYNGIFAVHQANGTQQQMFTVGDANIVLYGGEVTLQPSQGLNASTLTLNGTNIKTLNVPLSSITVSTSSLYTINNSPIASYQMGSNGFVKYLNGLTEQWMNVIYNVTAGADQVFNLPTTFANSCDNVTVTPIGASGVTSTNNGSTTSTVTLRCSSTSVNLLVRVIGH